jgi:hypothetical protein
VLLTMDHRHFELNIPPGTPARALVPFRNPLQLVQIRPRLDAAFGAYPGGLELLHTLLKNVHDALIDGLHAIFLIGAVLMTIGVVVNLFLKEVPLRKRGEAHQAAPVTAP